MLSNLNFEPYLQVLPNIIYSFICAIFLTPILRYIGLKFGFATKPPRKDKSTERGENVKLHKVTISRLGEFAVIIPLLIFMWKDLNFDNPQIFGIVFSIITISIIGALDSKYNFSEFVKLIALIFISIILVFTGTLININQIIDFSYFDIEIYNPLLGDKLSILSAIFTMIWIVVVSTAVSYVGGVDGLSEGTTAIAVMILTLIGIRNGDILTIVIGSLVFGGILGLLPYNFYPKVIMSEHLIYGVIIAILAIISKGKIAMSILLLLVPLLDFLFVFIDRSLRYFKTSSKFKMILFLKALGTPEKNHLHHKFLNLGFSHAQISLIQYIIYALLGIITLIVTDMYLTLVIFICLVFLLLMYYYINNKLRI